MFIITGLGRCGTSILMKYLREVGFGLGKNVSWNEEMRAGLELSTAYSLNQRMWMGFSKNGNPIDLDRVPTGDYWVGKSFRECILSVDNDERQGKVDVFKDPRFTWHPDLIEAWWEVRKDIKLIICHRDIEQIYKSRKALNNTGQDDPKRAVHPSNPEVELPRYKIDFADFFTKVLEIGIDYELLFFPKFLEDFESTWKSLNRIGLTHDYNNGQEVWNKLIDVSLMHDR
jgi:hypothetical protein